MLVGWITQASMPRARNQRASQKPSRPASKARAICATPSASPFRLGLPTQHKAIQRRLVCLQLLQRLSLDPRYHAGNKPALETYFDDTNQRAVLIKGGAGVLMFSNWVMERSIICSRPTMVPPIFAERLIASAITHRSRSTSSEMSGSDCSASPFNPIMWRLSHRPRREARPSRDGAWRLCGSERAVMKKLDTTPPR